MAISRTLAVRPVRNGHGIVALRSFRRGAVICEIKGRLVSSEEVWRYWDIEPRLGENCFRYAAETYLDPEDEIGQYANHSCDPDAGVVKRGRRLMLKAIQSIGAGEEVTHDYSTLLGADDVWKMKCNCGAACCRRVVRNISKLPASTVTKYRRLGIIPAFILATRSPTASSRNK